MTKVIYTVFIMNHKDATCTHNWTNKLSGKNIPEMSSKLMVSL